MTAPPSARTAAAPDRAALLAEAGELLYLEAALLDDRDWDAWLDLYAADCVFWIPAWISDDEPCSDPDTQVSLVYYESRSGLEDRVWRARSGESVASRPLPRTAHAVSNVRLVSVQGEPGSLRLTTRASWAVDLYNLKTRSNQRHFGRYDHVLKQTDGGWKIASKRILLLNDLLPSTLDFYSV